MRKTNSRIEKMINQLLLPGEKCYTIVKRLTRKTKEKIPYIYEYMDSLIKSHIVTLGKKEAYSADLNGFGSLIASNIIKKLPHLDETTLNNMLTDKTSKSILKILTVGSEAVEKDYTKLNKKRLFKSILIANRGEIALRIMRACKELEIETVVIYSKPEKNSLMVKFGDKAYCIGSPKDYLSTKKIIKIAKKANVEAIHPGYGFLSENANFAEECAKNNIKFIGPPVESIRLMGDKIKAKEVISNIGVPVISGTKNPIADIQKAKEVVKRIGYPVILKAAAGGGGKGMRVVYKEDELESAYKGAETEAEAAFGDKSLYIEKYLEEPRHIEFQILADKSGNVIHLGERDCSIQRRHQKLIEEAPSTALKADLRREIGKAAKKIASAVGYEGAGTVEFLLDKKNNYYFMEMNTRIQVEHGVTEMITGVDLVKEQIKIASGAKLAYTQEDIKIKGWAIECRINAEDPLNDFEPSTGSITNYLPPSGQNIRVSGSFRVGDVISHHYDPLISNLICVGENRHDAIIRMRRVLDEYIIDGISTNIPFHKMIMGNKQFNKGDINTNFIKKNNVMSLLKKRYRRKKELSKKQKELIITTAVSHYVGKRTINRSNQWVKAGRQELMENFDV